MQFHNLTTFCTMLQCSHKLTICRIPEFLDIQNTERSLFNGISRSGSKIIMVSLNMNVLFDTSKSSYKSGFRCFKNMKSSVCFSLPKKCNSSNKGEILFFGEYPPVHYIHHCIHMMILHKCH